MALQGRLLEAAVELWVRGGFPVGGSDSRLLTASKMGAMFIAIVMVSVTRPMIWRQPLASAQVTVKLWYIHSYICQLLKKMTIYLSLTLTLPTLLPHPQPYL